MSKKGLHVDATVQHFNLIHKKEIDSGKIERASRTSMGRKLWPQMSGTDEKLSRIAVHDSSSVRIEEVRMICKEYGVDANFLFGIEGMTGIIK